MTAASSRQEPERRTPSEAASLVRPDDTLAVALGPGQPRSLLRALGDRDDFTDLTVFAALLADPYRIFTRSGVRLLSGFYGPIERGLQAAGHAVEFVPADFRGFERVARELRPRVMATSAAPPDARGQLSLSLHAGATVEELRRCGRDPDRLLMVEVNPKLPTTLGIPPQYPHALAVDQVDVLVDADSEVFAIPEAEPTPIDRQIAGHARAFIPDGATLQGGIGRIPNALAMVLAEGTGGGYGIHTEMFSDGLMRLHEAGKVQNHKGVFDGISVATFALGDEVLYRWLEGREDVRFVPVEVVNDPAVMARNQRFVSINGALGVDLFGQLLADTLDGYQHSGVGGHEDFVAGGVLAPGGRSLVCLPSTATAEGRRVSRIQAFFPAGTVITTPRHHVDVIVTEYGAVELFGVSVAERARRVVEIAHPEFRDELRAQVPG
jgi:acyl-CoA hydrolase